MIVFSIVLLFACHALALDYTDQQRSSQGQMNARSLFGGRDILGGLSLDRRQACNAGEIPCGSGCISSSDVCCDSSGDYCYSGTFCWNNLYCCYPGDVQCGDGCMPPGSVCCGSALYCDAGQTCFTNTYGSKKCCPAGETCDGEAFASLPAGPAVTSGGSVAAVPSSISSTSATIVPGTTPSTTSVAAPVPTVTSSVQTFVQPTVTAIQSLTTTVHSTSTRPIGLASTPTTATGGAMARETAGVVQEVLLVAAIAVGQAVL